MLERFRADGLDVVDVSGAEDGAGATREAIHNGAGVVYQGTLAGDSPGAPLSGRPDFLVRADLAVVLISVSWHQPDAGAGTVPGSAFPQDGGPAQVGARGITGAGSRFVRS